MVENYKYTPQEAQHEGLSHNPLLVIFETAHALSRLSHEKKQDRTHQENLVEETKHHIFYHGGEEKEISFSVFMFDRKDKVRQEPLKFNGFKFIDDEWKLAFGDDEKFIPVDDIRLTGQIYNFQVKPKQDNVFLAK